jgi:hypothetical protein
MRHQNEGVSLKHRVVAGQHAFPSESDGERDQNIKMGSESRGVIGPV